MTAPRIEFLSEGPGQTAAFGAVLADWLQDGDVVLLHGDLGAGKTTLAKAIAAALRVEATVASPTFALVNEYEGGLLAPVTKLYHLDLYRLQGPDDLASIGFDEYLAPTDGATLIEWPERAAEALPDRYLLIEFAVVGEDSRRLRFTPSMKRDPAWDRRIADLYARLESTPA